MGNLSDRIGRKSVLIVSQIGATIGWTLLAFAPTLAWVFVARIIEGFSGGNISVTQAYVADRVDPQQRSRAFAYVGAAFSAGLVLGPLAGGGLLSAYGYRMPFLLAAGLQVLTLLVTIFFLPERVAEKSETDKAATFGDILRFLGDKRVSPILVQKLAYSLGLYAWFAAFALVLKILLGFGAAETSYFFASFGVMSIVFQLGVVGRLTDRLGVRRTSNIGFVAACLFFVSVPFSHTVGALLAAMAVFAFSLSVTNATLAALLTDASPDEVRGTVLGVGSSLEAVAGVIMPAISTSVLPPTGRPGRAPSRRSSASSRSRWASRRSAGRRARCRFRTKPGERPQSTGYVAACPRRPPLGRQRRNPRREECGPAHQAAALLAKSPVTLHRIPRITDVSVMCSLLEALGARLHQDAPGTLTIDPSNVDTVRAPYTLVRKLAASFDLVGPLLGRFGRAEVPLPGGCILGTRATDMHEQAFRALSADVSNAHGY